MQLHLLLMRDKSKPGNSKNKSCSHTFRKHNLLLLIVVVVSFHFVSCTGPNKMAYLRDIIDTTAGDLSRAVNTF